MEQKPKVLVVEDDRAISVLTCRLLEASGYTTTPALDGGTGLSKAQTQPPDVVLLDLMLPDMTGFDVCKELKQDPRTGHVPVIMLTALADEESRQRGMDCGAHAYLTKPYDPANLLETIKSLAA